MSESPVKAYTDANGYKYVETADWWKEACRVLPCFEAVQWPDYSTAVIEDTINGKPVVIQLWKGWCQQFLSLDNFPGGIGAEVGIYERVPGRTFPSSKPDFLPLPIWDFLLGTLKLKSVADMWWPVTEPHEIEFDFINPVTNKLFFRAEPENTYWLNKWMNTGSYKTYKQTTGKKRSWLPAAFPGNSNTPVFAANYLLDYKINGKSYPRW